MHLTSALHPDHRSEANIPVTVFTFDGLRKFIRVSEDYQETLRRVCTAFSLDELDTIRLRTASLTVCRDQSVEIDASAYEVMWNVLEEIEVVTLPKEEARRLTITAASFLSTSTPNRNKGKGKENETQTSTAPISGHPELVPSASINECTSELNTTQDTQATRGTTESQASHIINRAFEHAQPLPTREEEILYEQENAPRSPPRVPHAKDLFNDDVAPASWDEEEFLTGNASSHNNSPKGVQSYDEEEPPTESEVDISEAEEAREMERELERERQREEEAERERERAEQEAKKRREKKFKPTAAAQPSPQVKVKSEVKVKTEVKVEKVYRSERGLPPVFSSPGPSNLPTQGTQASDDGRIEITIIGPGPDDNARFRAQGKHTVRKILAKACKTFGIKDVDFDVDEDVVVPGDRKRRRAYLVQAVRVPKEGINADDDDHDEESDDEDEDEDKKKYTIHEFPCDLDDTIAMSGIGPKSKLYIKLD